jgi:peptidoglycan/LPS O-acetylase OafA/YrhL
VKQADILPLTSLRFFAALAVFASHLPLASGADQPLLNWLGKNVFYEGYWGVAFFFVLSGFILTVAYVKRLNYSGDLYLFWLARFARIYPLHLLTFFIALDSQPSLLHWLIYIFPPTHLLEFCCGIAIGLLFLNVGERFKHYSLQRGLGTGLELLALALFALAFSLHSFIPEGLKYAPYYTPIFTLIVFVFALEAGRLSRLLSAPHLVYLGEISFAFYMIHQLVIRFLAAVVNKLELSFIDDKTFLFAVVALVISLSGSALLFRFYEIPSRQVIRTTGAALLNRAQIQTER